MDYKMTVTETFKNDALLKQVSEAVKIKNVPINKRLNTKYENNMQINIYNRRKSGEEELKAG